ncbi:unnamed protein product [Camellia sinensis]
MPRPGPRPYECVRRAWHSDRHQPIRGSLIKEIFRVVNEIHGSATKKNKEWQEKLPIVVLKAEEIMYSKANSEAEYMDLKTLWDRANDAINTIIRRDESTETGEFLQPCIEAALYLGCIPRRASRSQRNSNPRCYLSVSTPDQTCVSPSNLENIYHANHITNPPFMSHNSNFTKPNTMNFTVLDSESHKFPFLSENFPPCSNTRCLPTEAYASSNSCSVYPLYYGNPLQSQESQESQFCFHIPPNLNSDNPKTLKIGHLQNLFPCDVDASNQIPQADLRDTPENLPGIGCDLSLRLGPLSVPCISIENSWPQEVEDVERSKLNDDLKPWMDKEFSFFPKSNVDDDPLDSYSSKWSSEAEDMNVEMTMRKRKAVFSYPSEDGQFCWQPKLPSNHLTGKMSNAGRVIKPQNVCLVATLKEPLTQCVDDVVSVDVDLQHKEMIIPTYYVNPRHAIVTLGVLFDLIPYLIKRHKFFQCLELFWAKESNKGLVMQDRYWAESGLQDSLDVKMLVRELVYQVLIVTELSPFRGAFEYEPVELGPSWRVVLLGLKPIGNDCNQYCTCAFSDSFVAALVERSEEDIGFELCLAISAD